MSVTGHHSLNTLSIYEKVSTNKKLTMGLCMNYYLATDNLMSSQPSLPNAQEKKLHQILPKGYKPPTSATITRPLQEKNINVEAQNINKIAEIANINDNQPPIVLQDSAEKVNTVAIYKESEDPFNDNPEMPSDFDLMEYVANLQNLDNNHSTVVASTQMETTYNTETTKTTTSLQKTINIPVFNNCKIGSITININK